MVANCVTPYWIKKEEKTNLKLLNYSYQRFILWPRKESGGELEPWGEDSWCGNWFLTTVLPSFFLFLGGDPRGQFLIHQGQSGHAVCMSRLRVDLMFLCYRKERNEEYGPMKWIIHWRSPLKWKKMVNMHLKRSMTSYCLGHLKP